MLQMDLMQSIAKYLARFSEEVQLLNANGDFSINMYAENMLIEVLNIVYGLDLKNLNVSETRNYSAIDLVETKPSGRTAFQITSTASLEKIKGCLRKFFRNGMYKTTHVLNIYILTIKQKNYSQDAINKVIQAEIQLLIDKGEIKYASEIDLTFSIDKNILDKRDLYRQLHAGNDIDAIQSLKNFLERQFHIIDEREHLSAWQGQLRSMFHEVVMNDEYGMTLDHIYTEPSFSIIGSAMANDALGNGRKKQKFYLADPRYKIQEFIEDTFKGDNTLGLQEMRRFILVLGYPGQGKSSLCKKIANNYIAAEKHQDRPLYYFQLRNIREAREFLFNPLTTLYREACSLVGRDLDRYEFERSFLILDGLDELYLRENLAMEDIDRLCVELVRYADKYPELRVIMTSRYGYIDDEKLTKEKIIIVQLGALSLQLQKEWLGKYRQFHPETWLTVLNLETFHSDDRYKHIRELLEQPLLLHMIASIRNEINEKTNRSSIYQQLFSELIDRKYAREGQLEVFKNVSKDDLRELIREVAFSIFNSGNEYITKADLLKLNATQKFLRLMPEKVFRDSIKNVMISFYFRETSKEGNPDIDEDKSNYAIEFLHKSLREYMTAEKIFFTLREQFLERRGKGRYFIDDARYALQLINEIFSKQVLSAEIKEILQQLIENDTDLDKEELADRILLFLPEFLDNDFIVEYNMDRDKHAMDKAIQCFHGLWCFISCLHPKKNYLTTMEVKRAFLGYLRLRENNVLTRGGLFHVQRQDLSGIEIANILLHGIIFTGVDFSNARLINAKFNFCHFFNSVFEGAEFDEVEWSLVNVQSCNLRKTKIYSLNARQTRLINADLSYALIFSLDLIDEENESERNIFQHQGLIFNEASISAKVMQKLIKYYPALEGQKVSAIHEKRDPLVSLSATKDFSHSRKNTRSESYKQILLEEEDAEKTH